MNTGIEKAIEIAGGQTALARVLGVTQGAVYQWLREMRPVSPHQAVAIEQKLCGRVTRPELCPDDWHRIWPELHAVYPHLLPATTKEAA